MQCVVMRHMLADVIIRHPETHEYDAVRSLVKTVAEETFRELFAPSPVPLNFDDDDWSVAWVAFPTPRLSASC